MFATVICTSKKQTLYLKCWAHYGQLNHLITWIHEHYLAPLAFIDSFVFGYKILCMKFLTWLTILFEKLNKLNRFFKNHPETLTGRYSSRCMNQQHQPRLSLKWETERFVSFSIFELTGICQTIFYLKKLFTLKQLYSDILYIRQAIHKDTDSIKFSTPCVLISSKEMISEWMKAKF